MEDIYIRYRGKKTPLDLPSSWKLLTFAVFEDHPVVRDVEAKVKSVLKNPVASAPIGKRVSSADKIAVMIEDLTRASPKELVLRALLDELGDVGISHQNISIIIALGSHRKLSERELSDNYGKEITKHYEFINHDCQASDLVPIGRLKSGATVKINRKVYDSSFKIGIGVIFPHPINGFGGGGKILFPGVADFDSILEHHLKYSFRDGSDLGKVEGNPFYEEIRSISKAGGLDFIINSVLDHNDNLYDVVCGDPIDAHIKGMEICKKIISKRFEKRADVTIITIFPYSEGQQIMKPLAPASMVTKEGGWIILFADVTTPPPDIFIEACENFRIESGPDLRSEIFSRFDRNQRIAKNAAPEVNMALAQALLGQAQFKIILVSEDIPRESVERLGFFYAKDPGSAFEMIDKSCAQPEVHVIPAGGVILPVL